MAARNYPLIPGEKLRQAQKLLESGERWNDVAKQLGVGVFALRNQMNKRGMRTNYPRPRKRTKAEVLALHDEPKGSGWSPSAANDWLRRPLMGVNA